MKKILITGANGQDGKILSNIFHKKKFKIYCLIKKKTKILNPNYNYIFNNLNSKKKISAKIKKIKPNIVIHLACKNFPFSQKKQNNNYIKNYLYNFNITKNLIDALIETKIKSKLVFAGSSLMYEGLKKNIVNENDVFKPKTSYSRYKVDIFNYLKKKTSKNFKAITIILFNHDSNLRSKNFLFPKLFKAFKKKDVKFIDKIYSHDISGDFSDAEDICNGIYKISTTNFKHDKIILSSGKRTYVNKIIEKLNKIYRLKLKRKIKEKNFKSIGKSVISKNLINFKPTKNLFTSLIKNFF